MFINVLTGIQGHSTNLTEIVNVHEIIDQYRNSVFLAKKAGFDGIEVLAQGDYLLQNFLLRCACSSHLKICICNLITDS